MATLLGTFPAGGSPSDIAFDGANVWVADRSSNIVTKLRATDGAVLGAFPVGNGPSAIAFDGANVWVANQSATPSPSCARRMAPCSAPSRSATILQPSPLTAPTSGSPTHSSNNVTKLRAADGVLLGTFPVGDTPSAIAFDGASVWVANPDSGSVSKL